MHERYQTFQQIAKKAIKENIPINQATHVMRAAMIKCALEDYDGNRTHAAVALGLQRATLNAEIARLQKLGLLEGEQVGV